MSFVHLHAHTNFSFGDGACRIPELVAAAAGMDMPALAVTDHEGLYGAVRFSQACKAAGIKPIVGVELTVEPAVGPGGRAWEPGSATDAERPPDPPVRPWCRRGSTQRRRPHRHSPPTATFGTSADDSLTFATSCGCAPTPSPRYRSRA